MNKIESLFGGPLVEQPTNIKQRAALLVLGQTLGESVYPLSITDNRVNTCEVEFIEGKILFRHSWEHGNFDEANSSLNLLVEPGRSGRSGNITVLSAFAQLREWSGLQGETQRKETIELGLGLENKRAGGDELSIRELLRYARRFNSTLRQLTTGSKACKIA